MDWQRRFNRVAELDDDDGAWEAAHQQLKQDWLEAYTAAFIAVAVARGWSREDAMTRPHEIGDEAFIESYQQDHDPQRMAAVDVVGCEDPP